MHVGTAEVGVRVVARDVVDDAPFGARLMFDHPVLLRAGDRFVIRSSAPLNTVAGGIIVDPYASRRARPWRPGLSLHERLVRLIDDAGAHGLEVADLPVRLGVSSDGCRLAMIDASGHAEVIAGRLVAHALLTQLESALMAVLAAHEIARPLEAGMSAVALRSSVHAPADVADAAVQALARAGRLELPGGLVRTPGWSPTLSSAQVALAASLLATLDAAGAEPPTVEELTVGDVDERVSILRYLERTLDVVQVEANRYYATGQLTLLVSRLREAFAGGGERNPGELREQMGLSRKYLIPFLEYCDRVGHTQRTSAGRTWKRA